MKKWIIPALLLVTLLFTACSPAAVVEESPVGESMVAESATDDAMADDAMADDAMADDAMADDAMADDAMADDAMADDVMADDAMADDAMADDAMADDAMHDDAMADDTTMDDTTMTDDAMMALAVWQTLPLVDANTGETFTLADFAGQTVFVEPMATWCTNCRRQLQNVASARAELGDDVRFIALSLETNLMADDLARYTRNEGFDWTFAVMSPEILQSLADAFGRSITSAPSTPHFIIRPDGSTTELVTGIDSPAELVQMVQAAGG